MNPINQLRRTGRTTRMLQRAVEFARQGWDVVVVARVDQLGVVKMQAADLAGVKLTLSDTIEFPLPSGKIHFKTATAAGLDIPLMLYNGIWNCKLLVDHHAIESLYGPMLQELHRYDPEEKGKTDA